MQMYTHVHADNYVHAECGPGMPRWHELFIAIKLVSSCAYFLWVVTDQQQSLS